MSLGRNQDPFAPGKNYMFLIAVDKYLHQPELPSCVFDIEAFAELMTGKYGYIREEHLVLKDDQATKKNIFDRFDWLETNLTEEDNLIIYFSGHGKNKTFGRGFWIPHEAQHWADFIADKVVIDAVGAIESRHTWIISDSCFSGSFIAKSSYDPHDHILLEEYQKPSRIMVASGGPNQLVDGGQPGKHSPFAQALLNEFKYSNDTLIGVEQVIANVKMNVAAYQRQTPISGWLFDANHTQGGQLVLKNREAVVTDPPVDAPDEILPTIDVPDTDRHVTHDPVPSDIDLTSGSDRPVTPHADTPAMDEINKKKLVGDVQHLVAKAQTKKALQLLMDNAGSISKELEKQVVLLSGRWANLSREARSGILTFDQQSIETTKLNVAILEILQDIEA